MNKFKGVIIASIALLYGCSSNDPPERELTPVTVAVTSFIGEAASFVADEKGFFNDHGLDVTLRINDAGSESVRDLFSGDVQIAHIAETPILYSLLDSAYIAGTKQGELRIIANMIFANKIQKVVARRDAGIETPLDIIGKRVGLAGGTQSEYHLDSFLLENQVLISQIDTIHMSVEEQVEAMKNGEIDVAVLWEPQASHIENVLGNNAIELPTRLTYSTLWLATVLDTFAAEQPETIMNYLKALQQAQIYIREHPEWTINLLAERTSVSKEVVADVVSQIDYELNLSERMLYLLKEQQNWMAGKGQTSQLQISVYDLIDFQFMEEVSPEGVTLIR